MGVCFAKKIKKILHYTTNTLKPVSYTHLITVNNASKKKKKKKKNGLSILKSTITTWSVNSTIKGDYSLVE